MRTPEQLKKNIISDMRVELAEEFDKNFTRKAFFTEKWEKRRNPNALGSLLVVTGSLRRSIQAKETPDGVRFTSNQPYATLHNEGGKGSVTVRQHTRKSKKGKMYTVVVNCFQKLVSLHRETTLNKMRTGGGML